MGSLQRYNDYKKLKLPWLPDVPTHWELKRAKQLFKTIDVRSSTGQEELLSVSAKLGVVKRADANVTMFKAVSYVGYKLCWPEDLAVNSLWAWQKGLGFSRHHGIISTAYSVYRLRNKQDFNYKYYDYYVRSSAYSWELRVRSKGIWRSRYQLLDVNFFDSPMICPPKEEQDQIVRYLDSKLVKINKFIRNKKRLIELLKEQKQAVINQAVTNGLDPDAKMKPSGVVWLGDVPEGWKIKKLRHYLRPYSAKNRPELQLLSVVREKGVIVRNINNYEENHNFIPDDLSGYKVVKHGQFVMNKMKAWQGSYGVSDHEGIVSPAYYVFDLEFRNIKFFHYAIRSKLYVNFFAQASDGIRTGQWDLSLQKMKNIPFIEPPESVQKIIDEYIPMKLNIVDQAIERINKEIDLITEYRTSLISAVVTGKVDVRGIAVGEPSAEDLAEPYLDDIEDEELQEDDLLESEVG